MQMAATRRQKIFAVLGLIFVVTLFVRVLFVEGFIVRGDSMAPAILSGEYVFVNKLAYSRSEPQRGDIVVAHPRGESMRVLKRIIGLPGERFEIVDGKVTIRVRRLDTKEPLPELYLSTNVTPAVGIININIDPNEYFALGDNREVSIDSRELGPIDRWDIKGRVFGIFNLKTLQYKSL